MHDVQGRRLPHVIDVPLVSHTQGCERGSLAAALTRRSARSGSYPATNSGICPLIWPASSMNRASSPGLLRFPGQVERIDGNAVPAQPGSREEGHEAERFGGRRFNHFPDVDPHAVAHHGHFVRQADVDHPERVFQQLDHLGHLRGTDAAQLSRELGSRTACRARCRPE